MRKIFAGILSVSFIVFSLLMVLDKQTFFVFENKPTTAAILETKEQIKSRSFVSEVLPSTTIEEQKELNKKFGLGCGNMGFPVYDSINDKSWIIFGDVFGGATDKWLGYYRCNAMLGFDNSVPISQGVQFDSFYSREGIMTVDEHVRRVEAGLGNGAVGYNDWDSNALIDGHYLNLKFDYKYGDEATESSKIPTGAIEVNGNLYMFYFSKATDVGRADRMNYGGCIKSTDSTRAHWEKVNQLSWANHAEGVNSAFYEVDDNGNMVRGNAAYKIQKLLNEDINNEVVPGLNIDIHDHEGYFFTQICPVDGRDGYIYLLGEGGYRTTGIKLARVRKENFEDFYAYEYFQGLDSNNEPIWEQGVSGLSKLNQKNNVGYIMGSDSLTEMGSGCGELTCIYNEYLGKWMVSYLQSTSVSNNTDTRAIVYRVADNIWGPYSDPAVLFRYGDARKLPGNRNGDPIYSIYGGILFDKWKENGGQIIYILVAQWQKVNLEKGIDHVVYRSSIVKIEFNPISYTVTFDANSDATASMKTQKFTYGTAKSLLKNKYVRAGYIFTGWNTQPDGGGDSYIDCQSVNNLTTTQGEVLILYAMWKPEQPPPVDVIKPSKESEISQNIDPKEAVISKEFEQDVGSLTPQKIDREEELVTPQIERPEEKLPITEEDEPKSIPQREPVVEQTIELEITPNVEAPSETNLVETDDGMSESAQGGEQEADSIDEDIVVPAQDNQELSQDCGNEEEPSLMVDSLSETSVIVAESENNASESDSVFEEPAWWTDTKEWCANRWEEVSQWVSDLPTWSYVAAGAFVFVIICSLLLIKTKK